jgi:hypothetical protein
VNILLVPGFSEFQVTKAQLAELWGVIFQLRLLVWFRHVDSSQFVVLFQSSSMNDIHFGLEAALC